MSAADDERAAFLAFDEWYDERSALSSAPTRRQSFIAGAAWERRRTAAALDAAEALWGVVANASGGDWTKETVEWQQAAARARDMYHAALRSAATEMESEPGPWTQEDIDAIDEKAKEYAAVFMPAEPSARPSEGRERICPVLRATGLHDADCRHPWHGDRTAGAAPDALSDLRTVSAELLRLYDWRKVLATMEEVLKVRVTSHLAGAEHDVALADDLKQMRGLLLEYGREKAAAWNTLREVLSRGAEEGK